MVTWQPRLGIHPKECLISILDPVYSEKKLVSHTVKVCVLIMFRSAPVEFCFNACYFITVSNIVDENELN